ncbi:MAG: hypothetical protein E6K70_26320, partial [Planctomycetota bacterium]
MGALWTPDGKRLVFLTGIDTGNIGQNGQSTAQLASVSLTPEEKDPADKDIDSEDQAASADRPAGTGTRPGPQRSDGDDGPPVEGGRQRPAAKVDVKIEFKGIERRLRQLTRSGDTIMGLAIAPDSRTYAFVTMGTEGGRRVQSIWTIGVDGDRLTRVMQAARPAEEDGPPARGFRGLGGISSLQYAKDGRSLYFRQNSGIYVASIGGAGGDGAGSAAAAMARAAGRGRGAGAPSTDAGDTGGTARRVNFTARVEVDHRAERKQVFSESWRVMKHRFYDADMHGVDWNRIKSAYEPLLDHVGDTEELHDVVSMMIGELNASHTGISGGGARAAGGEETRYPG